MDHKKVYKSVIYARACFVWRGSENIIGRGVFEAIDDAKKSSC